MARKSTSATTNKLKSLQDITIPVAGMTCASCERRVTKALTRIPGTETVVVDARTGKAVLTTSTPPTNETLEEVLGKAGYSLGTTPWVTRSKKAWLTAGAAVFVVGILVMLAMQAGIADLPSRLTDPSKGGLVLVLILGLTAGVSTCMALVGGLVLAISAAHAQMVARSDKPEPSFGQRMRPHIMFNAGRIIGFGILGALLGVLGGALSLPTSIMGLLLIGVAIVMVMLGLRLTGLFPRLEAFNLTLPHRLSNIVGMGENAEYSDTRAAVMGAATFFLPCGFTQAVQFYALTLGTPLMAGAIMATFAIGTTPGLLALAGVPEIATGHRRDTVLRIVGVVVIAFALINAVGGLRLLGYNIGGSTPVANTVASAGTGTSTAPVAQISDNVKIVDGVQVVSMTQEPRGYVPADTTVYAGIPIKWEVNSTSQYDCSAFLRMPSQQVEANLVAGVNTINVPALPEGVTGFTCVMGMYTGNFIAVPAPANATAVQPAVATK